MKLPFVSSSLFSCLFISTKNLNEAVENPARVASFWVEIKKKIEKNEKEEDADGVLILMHNIQDACAGGSGRVCGHT